MTYDNKACGSAVVADIGTQPYYSTATPPGQIPRGQLILSRAARSEGECEDLLRTFGEAYAYRFVPGRGLLNLEYIGKCDFYAPPQIQWVDSETDIVLMTIGGNDVGFSSLVLNCLVILSGDRCNNSLDQAADKLPQVESDLTKTLVAIAKRMKSSGRIVLVQYPNLINGSDSYILPLKRGGQIQPSFALPTLAALGDVHLQAAVEEANRQLGRTGAIYLDTVQAHFDGHAPKPPEKSRQPWPSRDPWIHGPITLDRSAAYHQNDRGHREFADLVISQGVFGVDADLKSIIPDDGIDYFETNSLDIALVIDLNNPKLVIDEAIVKWLKEISSYMRDDLSTRVGFVLVGNTNSYSPITRPDELRPQNGSQIVDTQGAKVSTVVGSFEWLSSPGVNFNEELSTLLMLELQRTQYYAPKELVRFGVAQAIKQLHWRPEAFKVILALESQTPENLGVVPIEDLTDGRRLKFDNLPTETQLSEMAARLGPVSVFSGSPDGQPRNSALAEVAALTAGQVVGGVADLRALVSVKPRVRLTSYVDDAGRLVVDASKSTASKGSTITSFEWDLDNDGVYESVGPNATDAIDPATKHARVGRVRITDSENRTAVGSLAMPGEHNNPPVALDPGYLPTCDEVRTIPLSSGPLLSRDGSNIGDMVGIVLECGVYEVVLESSDERHQAGYQEEQTGESWYLEAYGKDGLLLFRTAATPDLPSDAIDSAMTWGEVRMDGVVSLRAFHAGSNDDRLNSVEARVTLIPIG